jgi:serine/threonine protein kinase
MYEDDKRYYLIMESCIGGELYDLIERNESIEEEKAS